MPLYPALQYTVQIPTLYWPTHVPLFTNEFNGRAAAVGTAHVTAISAEAMRSGGEVKTTMLG